MDKMTVGSLFAGIGGFDLGFQRAGFEIKWQVEIDPFCRKVLAKHFPEAERFEDVRNVGSRNLSPVDVICGGWPCQDISVAGKGAGLDGQRSGLFFEVPRIVGELRPKYLVLENVGALLKRGLDRVLGALAEIRYDAEWGCIRASSVGLPHRRERVFIVAYPQCEGLSGRDQGPRVFGPEKTPLPEPSNNPFRSGSSLGEIVAGIFIGNGIPMRVVRSGIKATGNAVVPQIPEWIANQILKYEKSVSC